MVPEGLRMVTILPPPGALLKSTMLEFGSLAAFWKSSSVRATNAAPRNSFSPLVLWDATHTNLKFVMEETVVLIVGAGPSGLSLALLGAVKDEEASPIMCGSVTAYTACKRSRVVPGQWIVVPGADGGLGHFAVQYAKGMGMGIISIDSDDLKHDLCINLGAEVLIDFQKIKDITSEIMKVTKYGAHGVIVTTATKEVYVSAPSYLRPNGTIVVAGLPKDLVVLADAQPWIMTNRRLNIVGSIVGSLKDVEEALDFTARGLVHATTVMPWRLEDLDAFIKKMQTDQLAGQGVLQWQHKRYLENRTYLDE
ncbi:hypothetical protein B7463_g1265, partial [Scytalidium lignicola]